MQFKIATVFTLLAVGLVSAMPATTSTDNSLKVRAASFEAPLQLRAQCGEKNGPCDQNGCQGVNNPADGLGYCTAGKYVGCPCKAICGAKNGPCNKNGCQGFNGVCTAGKYIGCYCNGF
ncbi:hypothetical protein B0H63DRAFT_559976 [Podospora didyma]|uniref:Uncharacterized protein n=1 Tax=Podospora didyma TaxID=330526 RepID=A0AAE0NPX8_9PEZI|nr:hypothetical protein B0H63DRAFT_559976 [Podospora didyma]